MSKADIVFHWTITSVAIIGSGVTRLSLEGTGSDNDSGEAEEDSRWTIFMLYVAHVVLSDYQANISFREPTIGGVSLVQEWEFPFIYLLLDLFITLERHVHLESIKISAVNLFYFQMLNFKLLLTDGWRGIRLTGRWATGWRRQAVLRRLSWVHCRHDRIT